MQPFSHIALPVHVQVVVREENQLHFQLRIMGTSHYLRRDMPTTDAIAAIVRARCEQSTDLSFAGTDTRYASVVCDTDDNVGFSNDADTLTVVCSLTGLLEKLS